MESVKSLLKSTTSGDLVEAFFTIATKRLGFKECSIFLQPELVQSFNGYLQTTSGGQFYMESSEPTFVLAGTTIPQFKDLIGKAYYDLNHPPVNWVKVHEEPLYGELDGNIFSSTGLNTVVFDLHDRYEEESTQHKDYSEVCVLYVPITIERGVIGISILLLHSSDGNISNDLVNAAFVLSSLFGIRMEQFEPTFKKRLVVHLMRIALKGSLRELLSDIRSDATEFCGCTHVFLYTLNNSGSMLNCQSDVNELSVLKNRYSRDELFLGNNWGTSDLIEYSGPIDDVDNNLNQQDKPKIVIIALPVSVSDGSRDGMIVFCKLFQNESPDKRPFSTTDRQLFESYGSLLALSIRAEQERKLSELLLKIGLIEDLSELLAFTVKQLPTIVRSNGCNIFLSSEPQQDLDISLILTHTSHPYLSKELENNFQSIQYNVGEGKTGISVQLGRTLVINHYGNRKYDLLKREFLARNDTEHAACYMVPNNDNILVSTIYVTGRNPLDEFDRKRFEKYANDLKLTQDEKLSTIHENAYQVLSRSFASIPFFDSTGQNIAGVLTIGRDYAESYFSDEEITLLQVVSSKLASVVSSIKTQKLRRNLTLTLAHEVNTPLIGMMADAENISILSRLLSANRPSDYDMNKSRLAKIVELSQHNMGQVGRLNLVANTMIHALEHDPTWEPYYEGRNLYDVLKAAYELFEAEAREKGCDINEPYAKGGKFPKIEMSALHFDIAMKNLVSNAVKYSHFSSRKYDSTRYISIIGQWHSEKEYTIKIQNYGVGILAEEIETRKIFEPGRRGSLSAERGRTGGGMGLATVAYIIERLHSGTIDVESVPVSGGAYVTTFSVTVPVKRV